MYPTYPYDPVPQQAPVPKKKNNQKFIYCVLAGIFAQMSFFAPAFLVICVAAIALATITIVED